VTAIELIPVVENIAPPSVIHKKWGSGALKFTIHASPAPLRLRWAFAEGLSGS